MLKILLLSISTFLILNSAFATEQLLSKVKQKVFSVKDFKADASISIDVEFLKAPVSKAIIFYKSPGKVRIKSEGFSMLPKQGAGLPIASLLESQYTFVDLPDDTYKGRKVKVMKIIPLADTGQIIASTIWVDEQKALISKMSAITKSGTIIIEMEYTAGLDKYALPSSVQLSFDVPPFSLPKSMTGDFLAEKKTSEAKKKNTKGKAKIIYTNYIINKGISDSQMQ